MNEYDAWEAYVRSVPVYREDMLQAFKFAWRMAQTLERERCEAACMRVHNQDGFETEEYQNGVNACLTAIRGWR